MGFLVRWARSKRTPLLVVIILLMFIIAFNLQSNNSLDQKEVRRTIPAVQNGNTVREDVVSYIDAKIEEALKEDKGTGCDVPDLDPFAPELTKFDTDKPLKKCAGQDLVTCEMDQCRARSLKHWNLSDVTCVYSDVLFDNDFTYKLGADVVLKRDQVYKLRRSDFASVKCRLSKGQKWNGVVAGHRQVEEAVNSTPGYNIIFLAFDSTSRNGFIRRMPRSYKVLTEELEAVVLKRYNIVGDGTPAALFPILTGLSELELPDARRRLGSPKHMDEFPFIWYILKKNGYRTSYAEDSPGVGTFEYRFTGFKKQPTDHYLRTFFQCYQRNKNDYQSYNPYCVGATHSYQFMLNRTLEYMRLPGKKFGFTFIADITHDDFNLISNAEESVVRWLRAVKESGVLEDTLLVVMGDHGARYDYVRNTYQGKLEERLPLLSLVLPNRLRRASPELRATLERNANVLTTPYDLHSTLLDLVQLYQHRVGLKIRGADLPRSMSLLRPIPAQRSCSEAGIEPHWCTCLKWGLVDATDPMYHKAAEALVDYINALTQDERSKCLVRTLTKIESVSRRTVNKNLIAFKGSKDNDGYVGAFAKNNNIDRHYYQVKVTVGPGVGMYEASMTYDVATDLFRLSTRDISRTNAYNREPECVSSKRPDLSMYCYCGNS